MLRHLIAGNIAYPRDLEAFLPLIKKTANSPDEAGMADTLIRSAYEDECRKICLKLAASGSVNALPALICRQEFFPSFLRRELKFSVLSVRLRNGLSAKSLAAIRAPWFRKPVWNQTALTFVCMFELVAGMSGLRVDQVQVEAMADWLIRELSVDLGRYDTYKAFRAHHCDHDRFFKEIRRIMAQWDNELSLQKALAAVGIGLSMETERERLYDNLVTEFLNAQLLLL